MAETVNSVGSGRAAATADSDGADGGSGHGGGRGNRWETQGFAGRGKNVKWHFGHPPPPPAQVYIGPFGAAEKSSCQILAIFG